VSELRFSGLKDFRILILSSFNLINHGRAKMDVLQKQYNCLEVIRKIF